LPFYIGSLISFVPIAVVVFVGMRGDFRKNSRPINLIDANHQLKNVAHTDVVLNTPFVLLRTMSKSSFKKVNFTSQAQIESKVKPIKFYNTNPAKKLNVVVFIIESFGRENLGALNQNAHIKDYESYTPFIDSLAQHSLVLDNAYSNGYKSIHGMSSVLAGIPSFKDAFTSSPYPNQKIQSLVSVLNDLNYDTSFFHGAYNGSMGFLGFATTLGFDHYYGMDEYNNPDDFDGSWAIWDEPFFQYMKTTLDKKEQPFMATMFTASSHEPYKIPSQYEGKSKKGHIQMHPCVQYTDHALKRFFEEASKTAWFKNTLFVLVADHGNQTHYKEYLEPINRQAVPIMFYHANSNLKGLDHQITQQIDIYPTVLDYLGYQKPFRSWGRSLLNEKVVPPFCIKYSGNVFHFMQGNYTCVFDGQKAIGFYDKNDLSLNHNLIAQKNSEMKQIELSCKAFIQDYYDRIIDRKLN
jgi:phosphoglycerol transferase MdoB-like AlkP superfamily enzyme